MRGREVIQILPSGGLDNDGDDLPGGDPVTARNCIIWPRQSSEDSARGTVIIEGYNVYIPPGQPVPAAIDKVEARALIWAVEGVPGKFISMAGRDRGTMVTLKRVA